MKKSLCVFLSSLMVGFGLFALNAGTVGSPVSKDETKSITGGACVAIDNAAVNVSICSSNCGTKFVRPTKTDADGGSPASQRCGTNEYCTGPYGVSGTCAGG